MRQLHLPAPLVRLRDDRSGATAVVTGVLMVTTLGFVGLGTDLGVAYAQRRSAQSAADSAAYSAAVAKVAGAGNAEDQARAVAASYGFKDGSNGVRVTVARPAGTLANNDRAFEVKIEQPMRRFFSGLFDRKSATIGARAVAVGGAAGNGCIIAFNTSSAQSAVNNGAGAVNLTNCAMYVNSTSPQGLVQNGSGSLSAESFHLVTQATPGYQKAGTGNLTGTIKTKEPAIADPYAGVENEIATLPACTFSGGKAYSATGPIAPATGTVMRFCGGLTLSGIGKTFTFKPGVTYYITDGNFRISALNSTVIAEQVTFVLTKGPGNVYARAQFNGTGNTLTMSAPSTGPLAGLLFYQHPEAPGGLLNTNFINGKAGVSRLTGAIYFKGQELEINGVGGTVDAKCTQVLADKIKFNGSASTFRMDCAGTGVRSVGGFKTALVE